MAWVDVGDAADLARSGRLVVRHDGRQILLLETPAGRFACLNRCPHEGYPLREGTLGGDAQSCILTCQWHNWKFDLTTGETLVGGDRLIRFPIRRVGARLELDIVPEDPRAKRQRILDHLTTALTEADQERILREVARFLNAGGTAGDLLAHAIAWAHPRLEFGTTHAIGAAPDWLTLAGTHANDLETWLVALGEILGHLADDARDRTLYPYADGILDWDEAAFLDAIETQDEARAIRLLRGGLAAGVRIDAWRRLFVRAALRHYADFGHALIYSVKSADLIEAAGEVAGKDGADMRRTAPLFAMLVRALCFATREDLIPEFRAYAGCRARWGQVPAAPPPPLAAAALRATTPRSTLALVSAWSAQHAPEAIFATLLEAGAWQLLHVDERRFHAVDTALADNVGWLDFTHTLTFAEAGLRAVRDDHSLWPDLLLQLACFIGRNAAYTDAAFDPAPHAIVAPDRFWHSALDGLLDHGRGRFIISAHLIKTLTAARQLAGNHAFLAPLLATALNRFLQAPLKERHVLRTARQMLTLVADE